MGGVRASSSAAPRPASRRWRRAQRRRLLKVNGCGCARGNSRRFDKKQYKGGPFLTTLFCGAGFLARAYAVPGLSGYITSLALRRPGPLLPRSARSRSYARGRGGALVARTTPPHTRGGFSTLGPPSYTGAPVAALAQGLAEQ
jgi:hypothetical protein